MTVKITKPALNLREKLAELDKPSGIAGEAMLRADSVQEQRNLIGAGRKNLLINGGFDVSQRGDYTSATSFAENAIFLDRWRTNKGVGSATVQQLDRGINLVATAAYTGVLAVRQRIERKNINHLLGSTMTLSAWVKSNDSNASVMLYDNPWKSERDTHSGNGQWEKLSITFTYDSNVEGPTGYAIMAQVGIDGVGSGNVAIANGAYVEIKNVQLELGSVATEFDHRSYGEELALCQRYYRYYGDDAYTTRLDTCMSWTNNLAMLVIPFPTEMRGAPSLTYSGSNAISIEKAGASYTSTVVAANVLSPKSCSLIVTIATTSLTPNYTYMSSISAGKYIAFDAEL